MKKKRDHDAHHCLIVGERAEILAWKLRRNWRAKPEFGPKPPSNPSRTLTLVRQAMNVIIGL